jgi:rhamnulokinase
VDTPTALAVDLGSSSGRIIAGTLRDGAIDEVEVHRFPHEAREVDGYLCWDLDHIWSEVVEGLREAVKQFPDAESVSVDTWGVDFALLGPDGRRLGPAVAYRDERTTRTLVRFQERLNDESAWAATGIAPATINTANQLFALLAEEPTLAEQVDQFLFLPDYFTYLLTGELVWSRSIASTSGLCRPGARDFSDEVFGALGIPRRWAGAVTPEHDVVGPCRIEGLTQLTVVRAGAHDTACAVHALQRDPSGETYFLSCGSWSVLGVLRDDPLLSDEARALGLTNEARAGAGLRPLFNITGLWILQECQREWRAEGGAHDIVELISLAEDAPSTGYHIDPDEPQFALPKDMPNRVTRALAAQGADVASFTEGDIVRVILESLARRYARGVADLAELTGSAPQQLNLMGGGSRNRLLCQLTADALRVPVIAGPAEASSLGSLLAQFEIMGRVNATSRNAVIAKSARTVVFEPSHE